MTVPEALQDPRLRRFRLRRHRLHCAGGELSVVAPARADDLLEGDAGLQCLRRRQLPYWADVWPASVGMARQLMRGPSLSGLQVMDLGCGIGIAGLAAATKGAAVHFVDLSPDALHFARFNARGLPSERLSFEQLDWFGATATGLFDRVLLADVAYEERNFEPLRRHLRRCLRDSGEAIVGDPYRLATGHFLDSLEPEFLVSTFPGDYVIRWREDRPQNGYDPLPSHPPMTVQLSDLTIHYGSFVAVQGISAEFPPGAVGLLGRNGAGKSSILKALLGLLRPTSGTMRILDLPSDASPAEIRQVVGYMPEREAHLPLLNGYETVRLAAELSGLPQLAAARRAHEVLYFAGLDEQRYRPVSGYSTGMKQKVKLAIALVHDPKILFLDEPTNGLDPAGRRDMLRLIRELAEKFGKSIIVSSHILSDVEQVCEHVVLMEQGRVLDSGAVADLTEHQTRVVYMAVGGEQHKLCEALQVLAVEPIEIASPGRLHVTIAEDMPSGKLFAAVRDAGGVVREFREHRRTLEEVFLTAVRGAGQPVVESAEAAVGGLLAPGQNGEPA